MRKRHLVDWRLARFVYAQRIKMGLSQEGLAAATGLSCSAIGVYERGAVGITGDVRARLEAILGPCDPEAAAVS